MKKQITIFLVLLIFSSYAFAAEVEDENIKPVAAGKIWQKVWPLDDGTSIRTSYKNSRIVLIEYLARDGSLVSGDKEYYTKDKVKIVDTFENGILRVRKAYFENRRLWYEIRLTKDGTYAEMITEYSLDGRLKDGEYRENYPNGILKSVGHYQKGVPDGQFQFYCANGKLAVERGFDNGAFLNINTTYEDGKDICKGDPFAYFDVGFYASPGYIVIEQKSRK